MLIANCLTLVLSCRVEQSVVPLELSFGSADFTHYREPKVSCCIWRCCEKRMTVIVQRRNLKGNLSTVKVSQAVISEQCNNGGEKAMPLTLLWLLLSESSGREGLAEGLAELLASPFPEQSGWECCPLPSAEEETQLTSIPTHVRAAPRISCTASFLSSGAVASWKPQADKNQVFSFTRWCWFFFSLAFISCIT